MVHGASADEHGFWPEAATAAIQIIGPSQERHHNEPPGSPDLKRSLEPYRASKTIMHYVFSLA
jgi:hypothetical protein